MADQRLKGQELSIRIVNDGTTDATIDSVANFNDEVALEIKEAGYLGETVNRFDEILNGHGGDMEINITKANWNQLVTAIINRARRITPSTVFNVVRTDLFPNGDSAIYVYSDVKWGPLPTSVASRGDYVKPKLQFKCSERQVQINAVI